jgi:predicted type IV restriction endonuclease
VKVFEEVMGYDPMTEISREAVVKGKYIDLAMKIGGVIRFLVEVKSAGTVLRDRHTDQARSYAAEGNFPWVVLTNGVAWNLYHLTFQEGIEYDVVFAVDLAAQLFEEVADTLAILHRDSIRKDLHEEYWKKKSALSAQSIGRAIFTEPVLRMIRREIRRAEEMSVDEDHLVAAIRELLSVEAREQIGVVKVRRRRRRKPDALIQPQADLEPKASQPQTDPPVVVPPLDKG